jgi:SAM-dependent methyltransferase
VRLEGQAKAGFYPTPPEVARLIGTCLERNPQAVILDPCCGEGVALEEVGYYVGAFTHGIELEALRANQASSRLNHVLHGDSLKAKARGTYSALYMNPPYDTAEGERLELRFLWHWQRALLPGGTLVYIVPEVYLPHYAATLTAHYEDVTVWRFPGEHYRAFKQVVVFGKKRAVPAQGASPLNVRGELERACVRYPLPTPKETPELYLTGQDPERLEREARESGAWGRAWDALTPVDTQAFRPLLPLRKGHIALMMASGLLNNTVIEGKGRRLLVRGRVSKVVSTFEEEDDKGWKTIERETLKTEITALDLDTAELTEVA